MSGNSYTCWRAKPRSWIGYNSSRGFGSPPVAAFLTRSAKVAGPGPSTSGAV